MPAAASTELTVLLEDLGEKAKDERRRAFLTRTLRVVDQVVDALPRPALTRAVSEPSDLDVLLAALLSEEVLPKLLTADPLAGAKLRGIHARRALLSAEGGTITSEEAARHLGLGGRQAVDKRLRANKLLAVEAGRHGRRFPVFQFTEKGVLPGFEETLTALEGHDSWMKLAFFLTPNTAAGDRRPLDLLREASLGPVLRAARVYGEQGPV